MPGALVGLIEDPVDAAVVEAPLAEPVEEPEGAEAVPLAEPEEMEFLPTQLVDAVKHQISWEIRQTMVEVRTAGLDGDDGREGRCASRVPDLESDRGPCPPIYSK